MTRPTLAHRVVAHLRATLGQWRLVGGERLRHTGGRRWCPLESLRGGPLPPVVTDEEWALMQAADHGRSGSVTLRRRMLIAAGLAR